MGTSHGRHYPCRGSQGQVGTTRCRVFYRGVNLQRPSVRRHWVIQWPIHGMRLSAHLTRVRWVPPRRNLLSLGANASLERTRHCGSSVTMKLIGESTGKSKGLNYYSDRGGYEVNHDIPEPARLLSEYQKRVAFSPNWAPVLSFAVNTREKHSLYSLYPCSQSTHCITTTPSFHQTSASYHTHHT